ncbi:LysR family transcriptional regulator [Chelatococcus composti]|jgi:DNA-binding transcriptional LysR family regulator|uniref:DNA-binding transcriptional LysR family regulator n=1 Tax=Chelatococcus composti TaxID=1743235 RepID=A0A841KAL7_9HYPH|nr:LysR family transcriptional regulator [Chelatococcus composti]MBB6168482.1 DNA-binding transcriptional LysR family regulator [Chelatococcus composti]MBS7736439.1 LysR family transcriptional regulator [Chelatococcus composti]PZN44557.1 MAG: LysR family transcriptional regulator [Pseudomonadota bacterium]GGG40421.1 LysR family transcriptional regulator [Chelatococcus composti]
MNLEDLRALVAVAETGSLARAASRLNITQPAVTRRLQRLEAELNAQLLDREQKPARLTAAGEHAYREGVKVLSAADQFASALRSSQAKPPLRIGISSGIADSVLSVGIDAVRRTVPQAKLVVMVDWTERLVAKLAAQELDAVIGMRRGSAADMPELSLWHIASEEVVVVARADHPATGCIPLSSLAREAWVINPDGCGFRHLLDRALAATGHTLDISVELWGVDVQLSLVARGLGLGLVPARLVAASPWRDQLKVLDVSDFHARLAVWMIARRNIAPCTAHALARLEEAIVGELGPVAAAAE